MKIVSLLIALFFIIPAFAQESKVITVDKIKPLNTKRDIMKHGPDFVHEIKTPRCLDAIVWPNFVSIQPSEVNELPNGTLPLSKDLPFVHTIRGAVYTYDHLKYQVR